MEQYKVQMTEKARMDLRGIYAYIKKELKEPAAADRFYTDILYAIASLDQMPERYALVNDERLAKKRYRIVSMRNHLVFYTVDKDAKTVLVARILYARRDWQSIL